MGPRPHPTWIAGVGRRSRDAERGQGLVEFALVLPIFLLLLLIMLEFGLAYNQTLTIGLATREGARTGASLGNGGDSDCADGNDPNKVDAQIVAGIQRILKSPGSDVDMTTHSPALPLEVDIFKADPAGHQIGGYVDVWKYTGSGSGPDVIPGNGTERIDFTLWSTGWPVCGRNSGLTPPGPDAVGVQVKYTYRLQTALAGIVGVLHGSQSATIAINDQTVMVLNPKP